MRAGALLVSLALGAACGADGGPGLSLQSETLEQALNELEADLIVAIETGDAAGDGTWCGADPLRLCIGSEARCHDVDAVSGPDCRDPATGCYDVGAPCTIARHDLVGGVQDDHPFVAHPDDWDDLLLLAPGSPGFVLRALTVRVDYTSANQEFTFVDEPALELAVEGDRVALRPFIRRARQQAVEAQLGLEPGGFDALPKLVRQGAYDLGQGGIVKYKPWEDGGQNGCDEFYAYYASQFSTNIHSSCDDDTCTYFRNWRTNNSHGALSRGQFQSAGRLAQIVFEVAEGRNGRHRTGIAAIRRVGTGGRLTRTPYTPKIGDFFIKANHSCVGNFHVMMYVGGWSDLSADDEAHFSVDILHKSSSVRINTWDVTYGYADRKVPNNDDCADHQGDFHRAFYFGEADLDVDPDGPGPLTSGARPAAVYPVSGPNLGQRATQTAIITSTL